jgi:hypothetical protein
VTLVLCHPSGATEFSGGLCFVGKFLYLWIKDGDNVSSVTSVTGYQDASYPTHKIAC